MSENKVEIADILKEGFPAYLKQFGPLPPGHYKIVNALIKCRTSALGAHVKKCDHCESEEISYNSCRNRHCPKCQGKDSIKWVKARLEELLPVPYYHIVLTVPDLLNPIALRNKKAFYSLLFKAGSETLKELAKNKKWLGADIGAFAVLHTWGQNLLDHPHLHWIVPAGGLTEDKNKWKNAKQKQFLFPVKVISSLFQGKFMAYFREAVKTGEITFQGNIKQYNQTEPFKDLINKLYQSSWVTYIKAPFAGPEQVVAYLSRYTHRIAIANSRILGLENGKVSFCWKDYKDNNKSKIMKLDIVEFIRRFLLHALPKGFVKIRYFGFLCNKTRTKMVEHCRALIGKAAKKLNLKVIPFLDKLAGFRVKQKCTKCKKGQLIFWGITKFLPSG